VMGSGVFLPVTYAKVTQSAVLCSSVLTPRVCWYTGVGDNLSFFKVVATVAT
jgi:hypothetical protein